MSQENYYILLELKLDPLETDMKRIQQAIEEKKGQWSQDCLNGSPSKARKAEAYLEKLEDIERVMADSNLREKHAAEAIKIEKKKFEKIDEAIKLVSLGGSITQQEISELALMLGIDEAVIQDRVKVPVVETNAVERLEDSLYKQITSNLKILEKESLYDFLGQPTGSDLDKLLASAKCIDDELKTESNKDTKFSAMKVLIGHCSDLFETEEKRQQYDASLAYEPLAELDKYINIAGINGIISGEEFDFLMKKAADIGINSAEAEEHILEYCEEKKWRVRTVNRPRETMVACSHCGGMNKPGTSKCTSCGSSLRTRQHKNGNINPFANNGTPIIPYRISKVLIGLTGIILALISALPLLKIFITLLKDKSYVGNGPYLAATLLTFGICAVISVWGLKTLLSGHKQIKEYRLPVPTDTEIFGDVEDLFNKKQVPPLQATLEYMLKKDKTFIKGFFVFTGLVTLFFIVKVFLPDTFFWDLRLTPQYFSFPLFMTSILAAAAALRYASIYFHTPLMKQEIEGCVIRETINTTVDPGTFESGIKDALIPIQQEGKPNKSISSPLDENGGIHSKLLVETHPQPIPLVRPAFIYLYSSFAVILTGIGFLLMTRLPPDNISVLTVPTIAIGYTWTIIQGGLLVFSGAVFLSDVSRLYSTCMFKSVMVYVGIDGSRNNGGANDYEFNVFAATLATEMGSANGKRQIITMTAEKDSENAKKLVADTIESFVST